jgi:hypothetical protein
MSVSGEKSPAGWTFRVRSGSGRDGYTNHGFGLGLVKMGFWGDCLGIFQDFLESQNIVSFSQFCGFYPLFHPIFTQSTLLCSDIVMSSSF